MEAGGTHVVEDGQPADQQERSAGRFVFQKRVESGRNFMKKKRVLEEKREMPLMHPSLLKKKKTDAEEREAGEKRERQTRRERGREEGDDTLAGGV